MESILNKQCYICFKKDNVFKLECLDHYLCEICNRNKGCKKVFCRICYRNFNNNNDNFQNNFKVSKFYYKIKSNKNKIIPDDIKLNNKKNILNKLKNQLYIKDLYNKKNYKNLKVNLELKNSFHKFKNFYSNSNFKFSSNQNNLDKNIFKNNNLYQKKTNIISFNHDFKEIGKLSSIINILNYKKI